MADLTVRKKEAMPFVLTCINCRGEHVYKIEGNAPALYAINKLIKALHENDEKIVRVVLDLALPQGSIEGPL